jgi:hypothetical protein
MPLPDLTRWWYWFNRTLEGLPLWALSTDMVVLPLAYRGRWNGACLCRGLQHAAINIDKLRLIIIYVGSPLSAHW